MTDDTPQGDSEPARLLLPVPGLSLDRAWDVGQVRFHPAGAAAGLIKAAQHAGLADAPDWMRARISSTAEELDQLAVADVTVVGTVEDAIAVTAGAVAVLRAVQHMESRMMDVSRQTFGLPGQAMSALISYFSLAGGALPGWQRTGALAGWEFSGDSYARWVSDPAYRFLDQALRQPEADRSVFQQRALVAIGLLSNSWLSLEPDIRFLNAMMALEVLLGGDVNIKKYLIARRASYFICGWPGEGYADGARAACGLMSLPISHGAASPQLAQLISAMKAGEVRSCPQFLGILSMYEDRNKIVHEGRLGLTSEQERHMTRFIAARLLHPVLSWFAQHPAADLSELDRQIADLSLPEGAD
jgi:hypothetical protein